jgi:hypothetical protein
MASTTHVLGAFILCAFVSHFFSAMAVFFYIIICFAILAVGKKILRRIEIRRLKRQHGCQDPVKVEQSERIVGWGMYKTQMKAFKEHRVLQTGRERYLKYGNTWSLTIMGMEFVNVRSSKDVQDMD